MQRFTLLAIAALNLIIATGCGARELAPYDLSSYALNEFERRAIAVRLLDGDGNPVGGRRVRFRIDGNANGAVIEQLTVQTDSQGVAFTNLRVQFETQFLVVALADGTTSLQIPVSVSRANGGALQLTVFTRSAASIGEAQLVLIENFSCTAFDPERPPAPDPQSPYPQQNVVATPSGAPVLFSGLRPENDYAVIALGVGAGQTRGRGCIDNLRITQEQIDRRVALTESMFLEDFATDPSGNLLVVETEFNFPLRLNQVAALYADMADGPNDPIDFIIDHSVANTNNSFIASLVSAIRDQLGPGLYSTNPRAHETKIKIQNFVRQLRDINNVRMVTSFEFKDETDGTGTGEPSLIHSFEYFTADIGDRQEQYYVSTGQRVGANNQVPADLILQAEAKINLADSSRIQIEEHELSVPVKDAIVNQLLWENFNEVDIQAILAGAVDCTLLADRIGDVLLGPAYGGYSGGIFGSLGRATIVSLVSAGCRQLALDVLDETFDRINLEMEASGLTPVTKFSGSADIIKRADNRTIEQLTSGRWVGIGLFTAQRI